jgi:hypothetical protein
VDTFFFKQLPVVGGSFEQTPRGPGNQGGVTPLAMIKNFNGFPKGSLRLSPGVITGVMDPLTFSTAPEAFYRCVVVTVSSPRHRSDEAVLFQKARVANRLPQGLPYKGLGHAFSQGITHDLAGELILHPR